MEGHGLKGRDNKDGLSWRQQWTVNKGTDKKKKSIQS
jgi:hypothetical protein